MRVCGTSITMQKQKTRQPNIKTSTSSPPEFLAFPVPSCTLTLLPCSHEKSTGTALLGAWSKTNAETMSFAVATTRSVPVRNDHLVLLTLIRGRSLLLLLLCLTLGLLGLFGLGRV